jgi:hypothetical protein
MPIHLSYCVLTSRAAAAAVQVSFGKGPSAFHPHVVSINSPSVCAVHSTCCNGTTLSMLYSHLYAAAAAATAAAAPTTAVGELWGGAPARFIRKLTHDEKDALKLEAVEINRLAWAVRKGELILLSFRGGACGMGYLPM